MRLQGCLRLLALVGCQNENCIVVPFADLGISGTCRRVDLFQHFRFDRETGRSCARLDWGA